VRLKIRVLLLADPGSYHTIKWANALSEKGIEIFIFGLSGYNPEIYKNKNVTVFSEELKHNIFKMQDGTFAKSIYLKTLPKLIKYIKQINPDIIHAHYASSYGLLGTLTRFHPYIVSVWGSDVYDFPRSSVIYKNIFKFNLHSADIILSTSNIMAEEISKYTSKEIIITPFGIDTEKFKPEKVESLFNENDVVIGTIKLLEKQYGIEYLLHAFSILKNDLKEFNLKLLIVGSGSEEEKLKKMTDELNIQNDTVFTGFIPNDDVHRFFNMMSIAVFPSIKESFGVSALEANACQKPVVVSDAPGFIEIIENKVNGLITKKCDVASLTYAIKTLITNNELRIKLGERGRDIVRKKYLLKDNIELMSNIYNKLIN